MEAFWGFLKVAFICMTALFALFIILLALPKSRLRSVVLEAMGWSVSAGSAVLVASPIDIMPDIVPVLGQLDDFGYIVVGLTAAAFAYFQRRQRGKMLPEGTAPRSQ
jgi:uncharacterized membrane protein YkvA (DUF1232 family)